MTGNGGNGTIRNLIGAAGVTLALLAQTGALVYWAGAITTRVEHVERDLERVCGRVDTLEKRGP